MHILNNCSRIIKYFMFNLINLLNRLVECCKGKSKPKAKLNIDRFTSYKDSPIAKRQIDHQDLPKKKIKIAGDTPQEIVGGYLHGYRSKKNLDYMHDSQSVFRIGTIDSDDILHRLDQAIYQRLKKIGICYEAYDDNNNEIQILLPLLQKDIQFELIDNLGWFKNDPIIQQTFEHISSAFENLLPFVKTVYRKIEAFGGPKANFKQSKQDKALLSINVKTKLQKKRAQRPTNNQKRYQEKQIRSVVKQLFLERFEHLAKIFSSFTTCSRIHANKLSAYMLFENLLNNYSEILIFQEALKSDQYGGTPLHQNAIQILAKSFELLLPYALEITNAFDIEDLANDPRLASIKKSAAQHTNSVKTEFKEHQETQEIVAKIDLREEYPQLFLHPVTSESNQLERRTKKDKGLNPSNPTPFKTKQERQADRDKRLAERRTTLAQDMVSSHKQQQTNQQEVTKQKRIQSQIKIHELPSNELVWKTILPGLNSDNTSCLEIMFSQEVNHEEISHRHVVNLAMALQVALSQNNISCAQDLFDYVISRIHHRHSPDRGANLPQHYIDILRACFIIFGIFPKGWEPKTKEDFDAIEKYHQRLLDYFYWESRI